MSLRAPVMVQYAFYSVLQDAREQERFKVQSLVCFHMLYIPSNLRNSARSFIIHIITIVSIGLATDTISVMKSQSAQGAAAASAARNGRN